MPKLNTTVKAVRIDNDKLAELEERLGGQTINSWLNEKIAEYLGGKPLKTEKKSEASPNNDLKEIESMANFFGFSLDEFLKMVCEGLTEGVLTIEKGKLVGTPDLDLENFKEACHEMGADPQKVLDKAAQGVRRGTL